MIQEGDKITDHEGKYQTVSRGFSLYSDSFTISTLIKHRSGYETGSIHAQAIINLLTLIHTHLYGL